MRLQLGHCLPFLVFLQYLAETSLCILLLSRQMCLEKEQLWSSSNSNPKISSKWRSNKYACSHTHTYMYYLTVFYATVWLRELIYTKEVIQITWALTEKDSRNVIMEKCLCLNIAWHRVHQQTEPECCVNCCAGDVRVHFLARQLKNKQELRQ